MGLDMYLEKRKKNSPEAKYEEVMYWRKANQIRDWFVRNLEDVENCKHVKVTKEHIERLINDCKAVLANHDLAKQILPTSSGFFFGSTEYDDWYFDDLKETVEGLEEVLYEKVDWTTEEVAYYEWW